MSIADIGPRPQAFNLETETLENPNYRTVAWSGNHLQVTLMSIPVNGDIGLEKHPDTDQFIRLDRGRGRAQMGPAKDELTFDQEVTDGWCVIVPAGSWHNVTNIGDEPMQVYTVYAPQLVVLRRVDGVDLHRLVADVGDVVPAAGRNDDAPAVGYLLVEGQLVLAGSHLGSTAAAVEPNELVGVRVLLQSDVAVDRNRHEGDLQVVAAPGHGAVVQVLERLGLQVERLGTGTDVCDAHGLTLALPGADRNPDPPGWRIELVPADPGTEPVLAPVAVGRTGRRHSHDRP